MTFLHRVCAVAIFLGSCLLFLVEPMVAKRLLPLLGGSAAVWTTCLVFFQIALLLGYLLAHWLVMHLRPRGQAAVYGALLGAGLLLLSLNTHPDLHANTANPVISVFWVLTTLIGLPFLLLSAAGPLLQAWYARGFHAGTSSGTMVPPYRLFALSNLGSLLALVLYPWLIEPRFDLHAQTLAWTVGYAVFAVACGVVLWQGSERAGADAFIVSSDPNATGEAAEPAPGPADRILWLLLAACGSVLLCATTSYLSQNVAAIPLLWILPLVAYLLSFVLVFQGNFYPRRIVLGLLAVMLLSLGYEIYDVRETLPIQVAIIFFCAALLIICVFCHGELHRLRPAPRYVTSFYLYISAGGALGAIFVGIVAPLIFPANYEFACGLVFTSVLALAVTWKDGALWPRNQVAVTALWRLGWLAASGAMVAVIVLQARGYRADAIVQVRSFYGALRVTETDEPNLGVDRTLINGTILHGEQFFAEAWRKVPTTYYAEDSGVGLALTYCCPGRPKRVGLVGLGAGTVAAYGRTGDVFRFYEINPQVVRIARSLFAYLPESKAAIEIVPGDARLSMAQEPPQNYDVIVVDAFSGDAIPVHLLTTQAVKLYQSHLRPGGILAVHISNRYLNLAPVVQQQADYAGLKAILVSSDNEARGETEFNADWVLVTADKDFLAKKEIAEAGDLIKNKPGLRLWTDDYNSLLPLIQPQKWRWRHTPDTEDQDNKPEENTK